MGYLPDVFRIISWNMQGSGGVDRKTGKIKDKLSLMQKYMQDEQVIAICLQECSDLFGWWQGYKELAEFLSKEEMDRKIANREKKQEQLAIQYQEIGKSKDLLKLDEEWLDPFLYCKGRCSLGLLVRRKYFALQKISAIDSKRPALGVRLYGFSARQPLYLFSIHVPYTNWDPHYIKDALEYISSDSLLREGGEAGNWMCAGDFNHVATTLEKNDLKCFVPNMRRPGVPTTARHEYDYCFVGGEFLGPRGCSVHVDAFNSSDHRPVHFLFSPWPLISRHAQDLASKLAPYPATFRNTVPWQLYDKPPKVPSNFGLTF